MRTTTNHLSESIHIGTIGTMHVLLALYNFRPLDIHAPRWGKRSKFRHKTFFFCCFLIWNYLYFKPQVLFKVDIGSVNWDLIVQCPRVGLEVKFYMRTVRTSAGAIANFIRCFPNTFRLAMSTFQNGNNLINQNDSQ